MVQGTNQPAVVLSDGLLTIQGDVVLNHAAALRQALSQVRGSVTSIDMTDVGRIDSAGMAVLARWLEQQGADHASLGLAGNERAGRLLALLQQCPPKGAGGSKLPGFLENIGRGAVGLVGIGSSSLIVIGAFTEAHLKALTRPLSIAWCDIPLLVQRAGAEGMIIVMLTNLLVGAIMGFLGVVQLQKFGADAYVPDMVAIGHLRELGPIMTAIIVAGRSGAGFAAELGTMNVSEECDALRTMGFDPLRWLMIPRECALLIALPLLTMIGNVFGLFGGGLAAVGMSDLSASFYLESTIKSAKIEHTSIGMAKSFVFAIAIAWISCAQGLAARGGAAAVGVRTTAAVVASIFAVIVIDAFFALFTTMWGL